MFMAVLGILPLAGRGQEASVAAPHAFIYFTPSNRTVLAGNTFTVNLMAGTGPVDAESGGGAFAINAVELTVRFPAELLEVAKLDKSGSILTLWVREPYAQSGVIRMTGGLPSPGYVGTGKLLTILFRARTVGVARVLIDGGASTVLANDGQGINALGEWGEAVYTIKERPAPTRKPEATQTPPVPPAAEPLLTPPQAPAPSKPEPLSRPVILEYPRTLLKGRALTLAGKGPANATIVVRITAQGQSPLIVPIRADKQGRFSYRHPHQMAPGTYAISVHAEDASKGKSAASPPVRVKVMPYYRYYQREIAPIVMTLIFLPYLFLIRRRRRKKEE